MEEINAASTLISASCTTSWFDWIHGELWLCPNGVLRRSVGLLATLRHGRGPTVDPANRPTRVFAADEIARVVGAGRRNRWIPWSAVSRATLKPGIIDYSLHLELGDGRREKFLWLKVDGGWDLIEPALERALPGRFTAHDRPIG
jgi:hypothetical protein